MEISGRHPPKAAAVVIRAALVAEENGSAFHPRGVLYTNTNTNTTLTLTLTLPYTVTKYNRGACIVPTAHYSACEIVWLIWEQPAVQACEGESMRSSATVRDSAGNSGWHMPAL